MGSFNDFLDAEFRPPRNWSLNAPLKFKSETLTNEERELLVECGIQVTKTTKNITQFHTTTISNIAIILNTSR